MLFSKFTQPCLAISSGTTFLFDSFKAAARGPADPNSYLFCDDVTFSSVQYSRLRMLLAARLHAPKHPPNVSISYKFRAQYHSCCELWKKPITHYQPLEEKFLLSFSRATRVTE